MDSEKLIELVRDNIVLYDMSHKKFSHIKLKTQLWNEIGAKLNKRGIECKKSWIGLRDTYRRVVKKRRKARKGQAPVRHKVWKFEEQLAFLEPYMQERVKKISPDVEITPDNEENEIEESFITPDNQSDAVETPTSSNFTKKIRTPESTSEVLMKYFLKEQQEIKKISSMRSFLMSMADTAEKFSDLNQHKAKSKIFSIISEIELEEMTNKAINGVHRFVGTFENSSSSSSICKVEPE